MKAKALLLLTFLLSGFAAHLSAQNSNTPQGFTYQAVARDGGAVYSNQTFNVRFSIRQGAGIVFQEEHFSVTTNQYGLFSAVVGGGIPVAGSFVNINWGGGNFFLQVELDDGTGYTLLGDNRLWAVPYSLYAEKAYEVENVTFVLSDLLDVDAPAPQVGDALVWDGTNWVPGPGGGGNYFGGTGISISNDTIYNTGDPNEFDDITINTGAGGDLTGNYPNPTVRGLNNRPISLSAPGNNDVLKWNATSQQWEPKPDAVSTGGAFNVTSRLSGDGSIGSPLDIAKNGATMGQVLKWNDLSNAWLPANDSGQVYGLQLIGNTLSLVPGGSTSSVSLGTQYNAGPGINLVGGTIVNTGDIDATDDITTSTIAGGDLSGLYPNPTVNGLAGFPLSSQSPGLNQILKFNGTTWVPDVDDDTDADADPNNEIQTISITGNVISLSQGGGSVGIPVYLQGSGISISGNVISNTGDLDPTNDITNSTPAGGDLSGVYPDPVVRAINGFSVANTTPLVGQVYKWNGTQWIPDMDAVDDGDPDPNNEIQSLSITGGNISISGGNSVPLPIYFEGTGIDITNNVITNIGDTNPNDDITTTTNAGGDLSGLFPSPSVIGLQGTPISSQSPVTGQIMKFNGTQWSPGTDLVYDGDSSQTNELQILSISRDTIYLSNGGFVKMPYNAGAGINLDPNTLEITNTGDLDPTNELQSLSQSGNTITLSGGGGSATIQPYLGGTAIDVTSNIITNTGDTDPNDDITNTTTAGGDLSGTFPNLSVTGLNNQPLPTSGLPGNNQILKWNGSQWVYGDDEGEVYFPGSGIAISGGNVITNTGDIDASDDVLLGSSPSSGDVSGTYDLGFTVEGLQGNPVANTAPTNNQILKWNGSQWVPSNDENTTYNAGTGLNLIGNTFLNTGDIDASDDITTATNAAGDVSGTFPTLTVEQIQGQPVDPTAPTANQILKWNGTTWVPSADDNTTYNAGTGITISGNTITNTGDTDASDDITTATNAAGDVSGTFPTLTVEALQGNDVSNAAPSNNEILKWNSTSSAWEPAGDDNTTYTAGTGLALSGTVFSNTGDTDASDDITTSSNAAGDVSGTFPTLTVDGLQGNPVAATAPTTNQVLKWNGTQWIPGNDDDTNTTYTAGSGLNLTGTVFSNTGDIDASDDITTSSNAGGDASGTFGNLNVTGIQGNAVANTAPTSGQILKWNGTQWVPSTDDDTNTTYTAGTGLALSGTTFSNTGDTDASDDITTSSNAAGDVSGTFPTLTVDGLQGNPVSNTAPVSGEVLKWNGTQWAPATDDNTNTTYSAGTGISISGTTIANTGDTDASNDITTATSAAGDVSGTFPTLTVDGLQGNPVANTVPASGEVLKWNGTQWAPATDTDNNTTYTAGTGLSLSGTTFINTGDTDPSDDLTTSSTAGGDASGTFSALNVSGLQGNPVAGTVPASGEVLKWNGTAWAPATDDGTTYVGGAGITVSGTNIINTGDTDASDDITTSSTAAGDVSGTFPTLTVDGLQGNPVANTAPASGEVLKWNGTQWAPANDIDNNTTYTAGTGLTLSGTTFINTGDTDASDDLTTASTAGGDASGTFAALNVSGLQGNPVAGTVPAAGEVLKWNGTTWAPGTDDGTTYVGGTGITVSGANIINTGDTDPSDDITTSTAGAGDVSGTFPTLTVDGLQGNPVANTAPASGEVLKWNGTQWAPATDTDNNTTYTAGTGLSLSGTTFINTGDTDASDDLTTSSSASGDVTGTFSTMTVEGLQGRTLANTAPATGEVLKWTGTEWAPATDTDNNTTYTAGTGLSLSGTTFANTGDTDASDDITTATSGAGDVSGTFPTLTVDGLQGNAVSATAPTSGEVLKWNGTEWAPASDDGTTYSGGTGISVSGTTITNTGDTDASDDITTSTAGAGDVSGTFPTLTVDGLQGNAVSATAPASGEVLKWNGTEWAPATDDGTTYSGGTGISVSGTTITNTGDTDASDDITTATAGAGDVSGTFPTLTVDGLQGNPIANTAPASGEVLKWNGTQWAPATDTDNNTTYTAGTGLSLSGTTFLNTGDTDASDDITTSTAGAGDVSGTFPTLTVDGLQGNPVASTTPASGEVLSWNGTEWEPSTDANTTYSAGTGLSLSGTTFTNTGDTDASDDITTSSNAGGDVSGNFANLTVDGIQGTAVSNAAPLSGEILKFNGTQWVPSTDNTNDADADATNEIQTLSISGNTVSLSNGGGSVNINPYSGGAGISISGTTITNTGDTDASDDITTATSAAGDVSGTFPTLTVDALQGNALSSSAPAGEDVLRWNGTAWTPHADTDSSETNELQGLTIAGNLLTISSGNTVLLPTTAPTYLAGAGINIDGTNTIINTGDTDASDDITTATAAAGDVSGTFPTLTVEALQGNGVSTSAPTTQDVLRWNGTAWTPHADTDSSDTNEIQSLSVSGITMTISGGNSVNLPYVGGAGIALSGATIFNTGDTDASDDITTSSNAAGDVSGTYSSLTVEGLQGNPIANTAPASGEILKWNGTQWAPSVDDNDNTTYTAGTGLALSGTVFSNTGDTDASDDITTATSAAGDVSGTFPTLTVDGLQGNPVANTAPAIGEGLEWNGTQWAPATDDNTTYTAGTGLALSGTTFSNTGDTDASDDITTATSAAGDVSGTFPTLTVDGLQGNPVSNTAPASGEVLKWNGTQWAPATDTDNNTTYTAGTGLALSGTTFSNTGDTDASDDITTATSAAGDVTGTFPTLTVDGLQGNPVSSIAPTSGEVLAWTGTAWAPASDANTTYTAGAGMTLSGTTFINAGDTDASDDITTATTAAGDVNGTFPTLTVDGLQGNPVSATAPISGEVLKWNGTQWAPATDIDNNTTYTAGAGMTLSGTTFINAGDTDASDDITTATSAAGDVTGTFPTLTVDGLQGNPVSSTAPASGEILKWNGTDWAPAADANTTYTAGAGMTLSGTTFINAGDTDASDDITTATSAAGDVTGTFPTLTVDGIQGTAVSATAPVQTEFLKYDGTEWVADTINSDEVLYDASVIPTTDITLDLGSSSNRWRDAYVVNGITMTSDLRAKTNVENLEYGMDEIMELRPVRYNWVGDASMEQKLGLIAQEMLPIIGEVVQTHETRVNPETGETEIVEMSLFGVNYMELLPVLIKGMQEQQETLQTQQQLLELQSKQIEQLEKRLEQLENE